MIEIRRSNERGYADHGWLKSFHTFSFADYYDSRHMQFGPLRVINEDVIDGGAGFPTHGHREMEIITYPISGAVAHADSTGATGVIYPFEVQKMSAGRGIKHSEFNHLKDQKTHLLQIWIVPSEPGVDPYYEQKSFKEKILSKQATLIVSPTAESDSLKILQDVFLWAKQSDAGEVWQRTLAPSRAYWLQVVKGEVQVNNETVLSAGDAMGLSKESHLGIKSLSESEILFFDMTDQH